MTIINQSPEIRGQRITLRRPVPADIEARLRLGTTSEHVRMYGGDRRNMKPFTREDALHWFEFALLNKYEWSIIYDGKFIGIVRLTVNEQDRNARYAIDIQDYALLGKGLGTEVTGFLLAFAFEVLKLHRVELKVLEYNKRAIACYEKCGFIKEGTIREGALIEERWESDIIMGILEQEYRQKMK